VADLAARLHVSRSMLYRLAAGKQELVELAAPRGVLLYSRFSREGFGGYSWVRWLTQDPKGEGDNSMPENQRPCQCVWAVRWGTRVIWLKLDCLNPNLQKG